MAPPAIFMEGIQGQEPETYFMPIFLEYIDY